MYALGCVVHEMVSGRSPLDGLPAQALLARHAAGKAPQLRATGVRAPLFVERAVERALATNPSDRFATAGEFAAASTSATIVARVRGPVRRTLSRAGAIALALLAGGWGITTALDATRIKRVAVLPLTDLSGDSAQAYLVAGVHQALIKELGRLGLQVTALTSVRRYRETDKPIGEIARELGVQAIVEGAFFRQGDSLEISARLYNRSESEIWNGSYDGDLPNAIALYRGFARAIADRIRARLSSTARAAPVRTASVNPAVYEHYLRGMYLLHHPDRQPEDVGDALKYFNLAIEADPADPLAYAGAATAYVTMGHGPAPPMDVWPLARAHAERALRLDSTNAEAWSAMAQVKYYFEWDWDGADRAFHRANALNPSLPGNHYHYAWYLLTVGRGAEGIAEHHKARELDPLVPVFTVWIAGMYGGMGDHERAIEEANRALERFPDHPISLFNLGTSARQLGRFEEAIAAHERLASSYPRWRHALGVTYALAGRTAEARRIAAQMEAATPNAWIALGLAELYAALGDQEAALNWLEFEPRHAWWLGIADNTVFQSMRSHPRFQALVQQINLPRPPD